MSIFSKLKALLFKSNEEEVRPNNETKLNFDLPRSNETTVSSNKEASDSRSSWDVDAKSKLRDLAEKANDFAHDTADEVKSQGKQLWEAVKDKMDDIDEGTKEFRETIKNKAQETLEKIDEFTDKTLHKAKELEEKEAELDKDKDGFADKKIDFGDSVEQKHEGFFDKAEKWLEKNENPNNQPSSAGETEEINETKKPSLELPKD
ncbi:MAG: hypothetical protein ABI851_02710 [Saprospiraceae bacterium]